ncbi:hypothetical protein K438DRAFT_1832174 [Mycena galopus ATCC 62051]|nr:hypothetical protein K438DRAFT_1832174 [Mycena galopus ATCC 62051]
MNPPSRFAIYSLPDELLLAIVVAGQEGRASIRAADFRPLPFYGTFKSEWTMSHISRRFRTVVVGTPVLWTLIEAVLDHSGSVEILKLYLERSQACNVSATLRSPFMEDRGLLTKRLSQIVPHVKRLRRLTIVLSTEFAAEVLAPFRQLEVPHLQDLEVINDYYLNESSTVDIFSSGAPRLSFLKMDCLRTPLPAPTWTASLTHLELWGQGSESDDSSFLVSITAQCTCLLHLHLDIRWLSPVEAPPFHIPSLKSLHITIWNSASEDFLLSEVIDLFDTPALTEFIIDGAHGNQIFALFSLTSLPCASFPALTALSFINRPSVNCESEPFEALSFPPALFPALSSLTLVNQCFTSNFVKDILALPWPELKTLTLCPQPGNLDDVCEALKDAVPWAHPRRLPTLRLSPELFSLGDWRGNEMDVEIFDPAYVLDIFYFSDWMYEGKEDEF